MMLPVTLHGFKTWSLSLMKEHTARIFENSTTDNIRT
jgi:hypothetical protein